MAAELNNLREKADYIGKKSLMNKVRYEKTTRMENKITGLRRLEKPLKKFAKLIEHTSYLTVPLRCFLIRNYIF